MPGIVGYCSIDSHPAPTDPKLEQMVTSILHEPWYQVVRASGASVRCACVHLGHFNHAVVASSPDGKVGVMLNGWLFGTLPDSRQQADGSAAEAAQYCLSEYLEQGIRFTHHLNGQFNLLVWDDQGRVFLVNDRYGTRPWQYAQLGGTLYFAPEAKAILAAGGASKKLNMPMMVNLLSWGRIWIGHETLFESVFMLPPGSILSWRSGNATIEQYWDYRYRPEPVIDDEFVDHAVTTFQQAVARQTKPRLRYGVALSGGLDSRTVLAAMSQAEMPLRAYTWAIADTCDEVAIARQVAERLQIPWQFSALAPADFVTQAARGVFLTEGLDLSVQSYGLKVYPPFKDQVDILVTGLALDLTLGGTYLSPSMVSNGTTRASALADALEKSLCFSTNESLQLMRAKDTAATLEELRDRATRDWETGENSHPADQCDRFFLRSRVARYAFIRQAWQRYSVEDIAPTFDNDFIDILLRIPAASRLEHRFYQRFLQRFDPSMARITYQRTMLPPAAPIEFWTQAAKLEQQREQLYRDIWRATKGAVFVPYRRYVTNYDEWLRCDPSWIEVTDNLLLGPKSLSCERFLNRQVVTTLIQDHRSAKASNHKKILQLLTLELFLRAFFD